LGALFALALLVSPLGCGKKVEKVVAEHATDFARVDAQLAEMKAQVDKIPERRTRTLPRCKASADYKYMEFIPRAHNIDFYGGKALDMWSSPLATTLALRSPAKAKEKANVPALESEFARVRGIKHIVYVREHAASNDEHVSADMFVFSTDPVKLVCAFGFDGGDPEYGSVGRVEGKEQLIQRKTGKVLMERDHIVGASSGTPGAIAAVGRLAPLWARQLGLVTNMDYQATAKDAFAGKKKGLAEAYDNDWRDILGDMGATNPRWSRSTALYMEYYSWSTDGMEINLYDWSKPTAVVVTQEQALAVSPTPAGIALRLALAGTRFTSQAALLARVRAQGFVPDAATVKPEPNEFAGKKHMSFWAAKGKDRVFVELMDFSSAAQGRNNATIRRDGKRFLIVQGKSEVLGSADEVANALAGK
jgi:hypothetical protein